MRVLARLDDGGAGRAKERVRVTIAPALSNASIERLFATGVAVETSRTADGEPGDLLARERDCVPRASARRLADFAAGRRCARSALRRVGVVGHPLVVGAGGAPAWPAGIVGSISHCDGVCAAAVASGRLFAGLGLDIETDGALDEDLRPLVCGDDERRRIAQLRPPPVGNWEKVMFSIKESVFKCWYPLGRSWLEFHEVEVDLLPERGAFGAWVSPGGPVDAASPRSIGGRYCWAAGYVLSAAYVPASPG
jgi:4'-phosphopantetheinyl transferase EntD